MTAIVLLSGGQDSATCLAIALEQHETVHCICFDYGQRHRIEIDSARRLANRAGAGFQIIDVSFLSTLTPSAMTQDHAVITHPTGGLPNTFIPGRNALFLTIAATVAYDQSIPIIYTGVCQTDYSGYPDCRNDFIQSQQATLSLAMDRSITIETPLMHLTKAATVHRMVALGKLDWYRDTHTCYKGQRPACGECPSCQLRLQGFATAGIQDPIDYV